MTPVSLIEGKSSHMLQENVSTSSALLQTYPYQQVQNAGHSPSNKPVNQRGSVVRLEKSHRNLTRVEVAILSTTTILITVYLLL